MEKDNPDSLRRITTDPSAMGPLRGRAIGIIAFATVLALLYVGRDVLIPLTIALMHSLLIAPLVLKLRRIGLGQTASVLVTVLTLALIVSAIAGVLGTQVLRMAASLPQYERTIQQKLRSLDEMTVGRLNALTSEDNTRDPPPNRLQVKPPLHNQADMGIATDTDIGLLDQVHHLLSMDFVIRC
jgi:hypothetical protein